MDLKRLEKFGNRFLNIECFNLLKFTVFIDLVYKFDEFFRLHLILGILKLSDGLNHLVDEKHNFK